MADSDDDYYQPVAISRDPIHVYVQIGDTRAGITCNAKYSPDIIDDMVTRLTRLYATALTIATNKGFAYLIEETDDDDE